MDSEARAAGHDARAPRDEALEARCGECIPEDFCSITSPAERLVAGRAVKRVGIEETRRDRIHPRLGFVGTCALDG